MRSATNTMEPVSTGTSTTRPPGPAEAARSAATAAPSSRTRVAMRSRSISTRPGEGSIGAAYRRDGGRVCSAQPLDLALAPLAFVPLESVRGAGVGCGGRHDLGDRGLRALERLVVLGEARGHLEDVAGEVAGLVEVGVDGLLHENGDDLGARLAAVDHGHQADGPG